MSYRTWEPVTRLLKAKIILATTSQLSTAEALGIRIDRSLPKTVAAAVIEDHLKPLIRDTHPPKATGRQIQFLKELEHSGELEDISASVASAWIEHHLDALNLQALFDMRLKAGDTVALISDVIDLTTGEIRPDPRIRKISSIDRRGRVHFRGGGGQGAWPSQLVVVNDNQID
ncbi:hypothetical protein ABZ599_12000 [Streptomyces misionensis]|uniref:hypothetical protein n=1 Tax=Streptomyces misionensis TaxID=67331 RepID=UPI0033F431C8